MSAVTLESRERAGEIENPKSAIEDAKFDPMAIKGKISDLRVRFGITQKIVAIESGVSDYMLSFILSGKRKGYRHRAKILKAVEDLEAREIARIAK